MVTVLLLIAIALLVVPIIYFVRWGIDFLGFGLVLCYIVSILILRGAMHKTGIKIPKSENRAVNIAERIRNIVLSGFLFVFTIGVITSLLLDPRPSYFWVFLVILFVAGAFTGDSLRTALQKREQKNA
jgi:hypothetical protein